MYNQLNMILFYNQRAGYSAHAGFYTQGEEGIHAPWISGQMYFNMQQHLYYKPSGAPEATSEGLNLKKFPGGTPPYPRSSVLYMIDSFPSLTKNPL